MGTDYEIEKIICTSILMMLAYGVIHTFMTGEMIQWLVIPVAAVVLIWVGQALIGSD